MQFKNRLNIVKQKIRRVRLPDSVQWQKICLVALYILIGLVIIGLALTAYKTHEKNEAIQEQVKQHQKQLEENQLKLKELNQLNEQNKTEIEAKDKKLKEKTNEQKKLKREIQDLNRQLVAKREAKRQSQIALASAQVSQPAPQAQVASAPVNVGNRYAPGNCTWYVYNRKPNIGSFWGNASQWVSSAIQSGFGVGSSPKSGAIGVQKGANHVVVVETANLDGTVTISEMNYGALYAMNTRTVPANQFTYIYA